MRFDKIIWNVFYRSIIYSQVWISLAAFAMTYQMGHAVNDKVRNLYLYSLFFATLIIYNLYKLIPFSEFNSDNPSKKYVWINFIALGIGIIGLLYNYQGWLHLWGYLLIPLLATLIYFFPRFSFRWSRSIRKWVIAKPILLALVWVILTGVIPLVPIQLTPDLIIFLILRFVFLIDICLVFDIRDRLIDRNQGYSDWVSERLEKYFFQIRRVSQIMYFFGILILLWLAPGDWEKLISWSIPAIILWGVRRPSSLKDSEIYYALGLDGVLGLGGFGDWLRDNWF
ncbi:MAG: hypothetical protein EBS07_04605 [Sphingobacteriia bacterium]|nr:hypothetical protein [Sphingobacteriia bacterium]